MGFALSGERPAVTVLAPLYDRDELAVLRRAHSDWTPLTPLACSVDVHLALRSANIEHRTIDAALGDDEFPQLVAAARRVRDFWRQHGTLPFEGLDLLDMCRFRHIECFHRLTWTAYALRRTFEAADPARLLTFPQTNGHGLSQPDDYLKMPLLHTLARGIADDGGVPVNLIETDAETFVDLVAAQAAAIAPDASGSPALPDPETSILFVGSGPDLARQRPLIARLQRTTRWTPVQVYKSASPALLAELRALGHPVLHESHFAGQDDNAAPPDELPNAAARFAAMRAAAHASSDPDIRAIFANPHMDIHFGFIFGEYARRMAAHVRRWRAVFARWRPRAVVASSPAAIIDVAQAEQIPIAYLAHTPAILGLPHRMLGYDDAHLGAVNDFHVERLVEAGATPTLVRVTGDPGLAPPPRVRPADEPAALRAKLGIRDDQRLIVLITAAQGVLSKTAWMPLERMPRLVRMFEDFAALANERDDWRFAIRRHPRVDHPDLHAMVNECCAPDRKLIALDATLAAETVYRAADAIVCTTFSGGLVDASTYDRPVFQVRDAAVWFDPARWGMDAWPQVDSVRQLAAMLEQIFSMPKLYDAAIEATRKAYDEFCGGLGSDQALERAAQLVEGLAAREAPEESTNRLACEAVR